ncbi:hypothetical protein BCR32DRAFT_283965 [Anaeromyces robustus]|uniref:Uncharacterized protein n=1 Tax=Anaeromyces robustus TaxID=1754192 RepID=A0A1Y1WSY6_9FUNG|nr:hypothetical protein BCR32DRAFT_283965 [Anaeromyces robustus]|eukprot:ORX76643.1 hypothetical protein BCR32DRAFT_283965 [Anaeromyces robustus]
MIYKWESKVDIINNSIKLVPPISFIIEHKNKVKKIIPKIYKIMDETENSITIDSSNNDDYISLLKNLEFFNIDINIRNNILVIEIKNIVIPFSLNLSSNIHVSGIKYITKIDVFINMLNCYGNNLNAILNVPGVDRYKTMYVNPSSRELEIDIENVRYIIYKRLKEFIDKEKYCGLLPDHLTYLGNSISIDRKGFGGQNASFLNSLTYEDNLNIVKKNFKWC